MPVINLNNPEKNYDLPVPDEISESVAEISEPAPEPPDPFDPESLGYRRTSLNLGVKKVLTVVRCRKPRRQEFVRVRPGEEWRLETASLRTRATRETIWSIPGLWAELSGEIIPVCFFLAINRQATFLWPGKLPGPDGRRIRGTSPPWLRRLAERRWIRLAANMPSGLYDIFRGGGELSEPEWPELTFPRDPAVVVQGSVHRCEDHPVLRHCGVNPNGRYTSPLSPNLDGGLRVPLSAGLRARAALPGGEGVPHRSVDSAVVGSTGRAAGATVPDRSR